MNKHPLEDLITLYLSEKDIKKGTYDFYQGILKQYTSYLKNQNIIYAQIEDVISYLKRLKENGYTNAWIHHQMSTIKRFYQYLSINHQRLGLEAYYAIDITESHKFESRRDKTHKEILTPEQAKHLIITCKENRRYIWQYRDYAMLYLMLTTGLRGVEVSRAKKKDLRYVNHELILDVHGKGRDAPDEFIKITKGVKDAIDDYLNKRKDKNPYLFISHHGRHTKLYINRTFYNRMLIRVLREVGLSHVKVTAHALRHTAATLNLKRGGSMEETKRLLRHSSMSNTLIYAHHLDRYEDHTVSELENYILNDE